MPRGRYSEAALERARNAAVMLGLALLVGFYYAIESLPFMLLALAGWGLLAFLKPSAGLAAVAFAIPFFWHPKVIEQQRFPIAETLLLLVFAAVLARKVVSFLLPSLAEKLRISPDEGLQTKTVEHTKYRVPSTEYRVPRDGNHALRFTFHVSRFTHLFKEWNRQDAFAAPAVALLLVGTLSLLTLADPAFARDSARAYRWTIVEPVLFYFLLTDVISSRRGLWRIADFFLAAAVAAALVGLAQFALGADVLDVQGVSRISGVYTHPNNLALFLGRVLPFVVCVGIFLPSGRRKVLYLMSALPMALAAFLTYSRGAYVAVTLAILVAVAVGLLWKPRRAEHRAGRWKLAVSSAVVALGLAVIITAALLPSLPERIGHVGSVFIRARIWDSAFRMLADHPILGVGPDQFLNQFRSHYLSQEQREQHEDWFSHPHNLILDYWLSLGVIGVLVLLICLWRYFREALGMAQSMALGRDGVSRAIALGLLASMLDFLLHGMVDNSYFLMDLAMIFWLSCGLLQLGRSNVLEPGP
ncbi:MAG TPA: O-antigen ligase family protein [Chloroflexia bacterium]|nr:O-antigen ligase family protein [Chloroflexia bacterium]